MQLLASELLRYEAAMEGDAVSGECRRASQHGWRDLLRLKELTMGSSLRLRLAPPAVLNFAALNGLTIHIRE
jgi:hypothetical protein